MIRVVSWTACKAFRTLQVSISAGSAVGFGSNRRSVWEKRLNRCWSFVFTVETRLNETVNIGRWASIQVISGPAF